MSARSRWNVGVALLPVVGIMLWSGHPVARAADNPSAPPAAPQDPLAFLDLTTDQQAKFQQFRDASREKREALLKQIGDIRQQLSVVYSQFNIDMRKARSLDDQLNRVQHQLLDMSLDEQGQIRKILTQDQFTKLQDRISQWRKDHPRGPGRSGGGRGEQGWSR